MTTERDDHEDRDDPTSSAMHEKLAAELELILRTFRLDDSGRVIRISTREEPKPSLSGSGYMYVRAGSKRDGSSQLLRWHRVVFAVHHRELHEFIDHMDGNPLNNDIENLRPATSAQNAANSRYPKRPLGKSGHRGVYLLPNGKYAWRVKIEGVLYKHRPFDTAEEAKEDREAFKKAMTGKHYHRSKKVEKKVQVNAVKTRVRSKAKRSEAPSTTKPRRPPRK